MSGITATDLFADATVGEFTTLYASRCADCGRVEFPRRAQCPACGASTTPVTLDGPATARVATAVLAQPPGALIQAPYDVAVAEFTEGICIIGLADGEVAQGDLVRPVIVAPFEGGSAFAFRRVSADHNARGVTAR